MADTRNKILELHSDGMLNSDTLVRDLLNWLSEDDCKEFAHANGIELDDDGDDDGADDDGADDDTDE